MNWDTSYSLLQLHTQFGQDVISNTKIGFTVLMATVNTNGLKEKACSSLGSSCVW